MESIHLTNQIVTPIDITPKAELVCHNNPFNPNDTSTVIVPIGSLCSEVLKDFSYDTEFYDLVISKNQEILDVDFVIEEHDIVSFLVVPKGGGGGGKQILMIVAMVALAVVTAGVGSALVGGTFMAGMGVGMGTMMSAAIAGGAWLAVGGMAATFILGTMLISSLFKPSGGPSVPSMQSFEQSSTYGWNVAGNSLQQGGVVPVLYGTHKIVPQYIGKYLETINDTQYLKVLLALGEGPFDYIRDVEINDAPISNFKNTYFDTRLGTNDQLIINDFNDTWSDQGVSKKLTDSSTWVYAQTTGDAVTSFTVGVVCPNGVYYANDQGGMSSYSVTIDIEYRVRGTDTWFNMATSDFVKDMLYYYVDQNPVSSSIPVSDYFYLPEPYADTTGPFDVYSQVIYSKCWGPCPGVVFDGTVASLPSGEISGRSSYMGQMAWISYKKAGLASYFTITDSKAASVRRSYKAMNLPAAQYEVRMKFQDTPSTSSRYGSATYFEFLQEAISDDFIYPNTGLLALNMQATDQLSGGMPKVSCVASRTTGTYGRLDNPAWACLDLLMNSRYGAGIPLSRIDFPSFQSWADYCTTEGFTVNLYLDQGLTLTQSLQLIGQLGRGTIMQYGSSFTALVDKAELMPVQGFLFSMGNIIQDSFSETFLPLKDRANILEVTYYDVEDNYERTSIEVSQGNYDLVNQVNKTSLNLLGCTTKEQALRQAKYHLNQNRYLTITATWEASIDAISCKVGDIVNVAHDVPQWGVSGRIISNTTNSITVDRDDIVLEVGKTYYIQISDSNTDEQIYVPITSTTGNTLNTPSMLGTIGEYSVYAFGEVNRHAKKMRVLSISTAGDLKRKLSAIEYNENVYNDLVPVPVPLQIQDLRTKDLIVSEYMRASLAGAIDTVVQLNWKGAALSYPVSYKKATDASWISLGNARGNTFEIENLIDNETYDFMVDGVVVQYKVAGQTTPPPEVTSLVGTEFANTFTLNWDYVYKPVDFSRFEVYANGELIGSTITNTFSKYISTIRPTTFGVVAVDMTGNMSIPKSVVINIAGLGQVVGLKSYYVNEYTRMVWDRVIDPRQPIDYEIRMGTEWESGSIMGRTSTPEYTISSNGDYMIKAHYTYPDGTEIYSTLETQLSIEGAVLPKNIVATYDEKATGWSGEMTNLFINPDGNLELMSENIDNIPIIDAELVFDYAGGIQPQGIYEIPPEHIVDIGTAQVCRLWVDYMAEGRIVTDRVDSIFDFDAWISVDGRSSDYILRPQIAIAQDDSIFGPWEDFVVGEYIGRKFKFRGVFYSLSPDTTCILSKAIFFVDMPDKLQSANSVVVGTSGISVVYPIAFQVPPNVQITITSAADGDDAILTNETALGFDLIIHNIGTPVTRNINWLAKGY